MKLLNQIALLLVVIGAINWGLVGLFDLNIVHKLVGHFDWLEKAVYIAVGASGLWVALTQLAADVTKG